MADCMNDGIEYDAELEYVTFVAKHGHEKNEFDIDVPIQITLGVAIALCGTILFVVPISLCQTWAPRIIATGVGIAADGCMDRKKEKKLVH